jgi:hypothetical protein
MEIHWNGGDCDICGGPPFCITCLALYDYIHSEEEVKPQKGPKKSEHTGL